MPVTISCEVGVMGFDKGRERWLACALARREKTMDEGNKTGTLPREILGGTLLCLFQGSWNSRETRPLCFDREAVERVGRHGRLSPNKGRPSSSRAHMDVAATWDIEAFEMGLLGIDIPS